MDKVRNLVDEFSQKVFDKEELLSLGARSIDDRRKDLLYIDFRGFLDKEMFNYRFIYHEMREGYVLRTRVNLMKSKSN